MFTLYLIDTINKPLIRLTCDTGAIRVYHLSLDADVLKKKNIDLSSIGFLHEPLENYLRQGIHFLLRCYGQSKVETLNDARIEMIHLFDVGV